MPFCRTLTEVALAILSQEGLQHCNALNCTNITLHKYCLARILHCTNIALHKYYILQILLWTTIALYISWHTEAASYCIDTPGAGGKLSQESSQLARSDKSLRATVTVYKLYIETVHSGLKTRQKCRNRALYYIESGWLVQQWVLHYIEASSMYLK